MREIKFRAWDTEKSEWVLDNGTTFTSAEISEGPVMISLSGHLRVFGAHHLPLKDDKADPELITGCLGGPSHSEYESTHPCDTDPPYKRQYILEQFTGAYDKNDVEIYDGDIVKAKGNLEPQAVSMQRGMWIVGGGIGPATLWNWRRGHIEVIGNIHENPELLK